MPSTKALPLSKAFDSEVVSKEISNFDSEAVKYKAAEAPDEKFRPFRLQHGIYGQRQAGVQMIRVKVPAGLLNAAQLRALADVAERHAPLKIGHITTRQNFQFHFIQLEDIAQVMNIINAVGLTSREACGNTVRNITGSYFSGLCPNEPFDSAPYAIAAFEYFLRKPENQNLPRKFKISFSGCTDVECTQNPINDIAATSVVRDVNGQTVKGFRIEVGGGLGASPNSAALVTEFVSVDEYLSLIEAVIAYFNRDGERKNRDRARIKFLLRKVGIEKFNEEVFKLWEGGLRKTISVGPVADVLPVPSNILSPASVSGPEAVSSDKVYQEWLKYNVKTQRQIGFNIAIVKLFLGDLTVEQFRTLADLAEKFGDGTMRTMNNQNICFAWIQTALLPKLYATLKATGLGDAGADHISDVTSCPGGDSCNLAFTKSRGLGRLLTRHLQDTYGNAEDLEGAHIKISGCPNSCGQHHIGTIGFFGGVQSTPDKTHIPSYSLLLGGGIGPEGAKFGKITLRLPAANCPEAVDRLIALYREQKQNSETMVSFVRRVDPALVKERLKDLTVIDPKNEKIFIDLGDTEKFKFSGIGQGECAV